MSVVKCLVAAGAVVLFSVASVRAAPVGSIRGRMKQEGCFTCHAVDHRKVGPAFAWIAYRYRDSQGAIERLAERVIKGGTGYWAPWTYGTPMPAHPRLGLGQAEAMARWVMVQPPAKPPPP